jgi:glycopeptide antibiotics resistance protein
MGIIVNDIEIPFWPFGVLGIICIMIILWKKKRSFPNLLFFLLFSIYELFVIDKVFFPLQINGDFVNVMRQVPVFSQVNIIPLYFGSYPLNKISFLGIIFNIILTIPCGFGLCFLTRIRMKDIIWISVSVGFGIEIMQLVISLILMYPYRVIDINDAILNAAGVLIGFGLFKVFAWFYLQIPQRYKLQRGLLTSYIYEVIQQVQTPDHSVK